MTNPPQPRAAPPSIKDFEIIKPISKGAFGSVYLARKKTTGDYYAIKALKKTDMVAKNQVANVKAERAILMWQGESDFVAKLYWTFPSKDYIFLVMEYLNGGDCASLVRALGTLTEDWAKKYIAEVVLGIQHLHSREIVHRDLKPDNLLIDQNGHLKLTDFGLSRMGLIGRQKRALNSKAELLAPDPLKQGPFARSFSMGSSRSTSFDIHNPVSPGSTPAMTPVFGDLGQPSYFNLSREPSTSGNRELRRHESSTHSDTGDADQLHTAFRRMSLYEETYNSTRQSPQLEDLHRDDLSTGATDIGNLHRSVSNSSASKDTSTSQHGSMQPPPMALFDPEDSNRRFVGTPDYLAPETINGLGQDEMSDWWSLGCILFEFLFGYPPFHADTPDQVFDKILSRKIDWPSDDGEVSDEAKDLMNQLMCLDPSKRLGANVNEKYNDGGEEIRKHPWFVDVKWESVNQDAASFIPAPEHPEDTEYFDARGATTQDFASEFEDQKSSPIGTPSSEYPDRPHDALSKVRNQVNSMKRNLMPLHIPKHVREGGRNRRLSEPVVADDFGQFSFKNLPVLEKANKDVIQKLRAEAMQAQSRSAQQSQHQQSQHQPQHQSVTQPNSATNASPPSLDASPIMSASVKRTMSTSNRSTSPTTHAHSNSSPSRASQPPSPLVQFSAGHHHERRKTSSGSSQSSNSLQPGGFFDIPRLPPALKTSSSASSPVRTVKSPLVAEKEPHTPQLGSSGSGSPRTRSHTVGSNESAPSRDRPMSHHAKRRSQVMDVSPSSSDTDETRQKALLRVQRRRQSSRRLSQISLLEGPIFRPLDVLVCEDHPVSRLVIEKLLEKIRCRAIIVSDGTEAIRYAMSSVKFDVILTEFKLPQVNGEDVARMIRETKNANSHTPIIACTGYLKELQGPHHFDALVEKPPTAPKLTEALSRLCQWKAPPPGWEPPRMPPHYSTRFHSSSLRNESLNTEESPTSTSSGFALAPSTSYKGSSREQSVSSTDVLTEPDIRPEDTAITVTKPMEDVLSERRGSGLGIATTEADRPRVGGVAHAMAALTHQDSAPPDIEFSEVRKKPSAELIEAKRKAHGRERAGGGDWGDDEDDELGQHRPRSRSPRAKGYPIQGTSKLASELLRTDSSGSVVSMVQASAPEATLAVSPPSEGIIKASIEGRHLEPSATTPPERFPLAAGDSSEDFDMEATPTPHAMDPFNEAEEERTPKPPSNFSHIEPQGQSTQ